MEEDMEEKTDDLEKSFISDSKANEIAVTAEVDTKILKKLVTKAHKVAIANAIRVKTQILYITINDKGIRIVADNGEDVLEVEDNTVTYPVSISISIDSKKFIDLVTALDNNPVTLSCNEEQSILFLDTKTGGHFEFGARTDVSTGQSFILEPQYKIENTEELQTANYIELQNVIEKTKPFRLFAKNLELGDGIYFADDVMISSDSSVILMENTLDIFRGKEFFIDSDFATLVDTLEFDKDSFKVGYTENVDNSFNVKAGLIFTDGTTTLSGPVFEITGTAKDMVDVCKTLWSKQYTQSIEIDTKSCIEALRRMLPFSTRGYLSKAATFSLTGNELSITSIDKTCKEVIPVLNKENYTNNKDLPIEKLYKIIESIQAPIFNYVITDSDDNYIELSYENYKCIVGIISDNDF